MFEQSLGLRENPFVAGHQPRFVYPSREHQEALAHLRFGIENREPFVLITGEVGTGKTTAIYDALSGWGTRAVVALITNSALTRAELIEEIALRFGLALTPGMTKPQALVLLERHLRAVMARGEMAILLLDEAQNLERELLEEIRLLSNLEQDGQKLMQIFLVGQPELEFKLGQPELRQLRQRIAVHYRLQPMSAEETMHYLHHRIAVAGGNANQLFPLETCREVHRLTHGIPREINTVASQAMLNAYVDDSHVVRPQHVNSVARDTEFKSVLDVHGPRPGVAAAAAPSLAPPPDFESGQSVVLPAATRAPVIPAAVPQVIPAAPAPVIPAAMPPAAPGPPVVVPAAAWPSPPVAEPEVFSESFETVEPPVVPAPPAIELEAGAEAEPGPEELPTPTPDDMEAILAEATAPWSAGEALPEEPVTEIEAEPAPAMESDAEADIAAENGAGAAPIGMPDWLEQAIAKHAPAGGAVAPEPVAPAARVSEPLPPVVEPFRSTAPAAEPEVIPAASRPSFAEALAREQSREGAREPELIAAGAPGESTVSPRTARILQHPASATGLEPDFLPGRLRAKLAAQEGEKAPRSRFNIAWVLASIFGVAAVVAIALAFRFGVFEGKRGPEGTPAMPAVAGKTTPKNSEPAAKPAPAPTVATTDSAVGMPPAPEAAAPGSGSGATVPASGVPYSGLGTSPQPASPSATSAAPVAPPVRRIYGIAVGTYFDRDRALQEAQRVGASLNLAARALPVAEGGATMFRAVVGRFTDYAEAERMAGALTGRGLANEGRVVVIGTAQ